MEAASRAWHVRESLCPLGTAHDKANLVIIQTGIWLIFLSLLVFIFLFCLFILVLYIYDLVYFLLIIY